MDYVPRAPPSVGVIVVCVLVAVVLVAATAVVLRWQNVMHETRVLRVVRAFCNDACLLVS